MRPTTRKIINITVQTVASSFAHRRQKIAEALGLGEINDSRVSLGTATFAPDQLEVMKDLLYACDFYIGLLAEYIEPEFLSKTFTWRRIWVNR